MTVGFITHKLCLKLLQLIKTKIEFIFENIPDNELLECFTEILSPNEQCLE